MKRIGILPLVAVCCLFTGCGPAETVHWTDTVQGKGETATLGKTISVEYTGKLKNGIVFDSNVGGVPFTFTIGQGQVIRGWDQGLIDMKVGGERDLEVPSSLAYGANSPSPLIPANADLDFHIKLLSVK